MVAKFNILLVSYTPLSRERILTVLAESNLAIGYVCVSLRDDFLSLLPFGWDVVVADYSLADFNTLEALQLMYTQGWKIPFVIVNGTDDVSVAVKCIKAGATDYLLRHELVRLPQVIKQAKTQQIAKRQIQASIESQTSDLESRLHEQIGELSQLEATLHKIETQLRTLIAKNPDGIVVVDQRGVVRFMNSAAQTLFARQAEELLGELFGFPTVDGDTIEVEIWSFKQEKTAISCDGKRIAQLRTLEIKWEGENAYLLSFRDITEYKQAEKERHQLLEQAQKAHRIKDEFFAILSHELRTPLNPILGWAKLLKNGSISPLLNRQALETIERNASKLVQLVDNLLDISSIWHGQLNLNCVRVDLTKIINKALETIQLAAEAKLIEVTSVLSADVGFVFGDPDRLQQVIWNLLSNAVKFTPVYGRVTVKLERVGYHAQVQVIDTGIGIKPEFLPHVFDYFRQQDNSYSKNFGGLGLGLATARHLVELHGGTLQVESPGERQGATFTLKLPLINQIKQRVPRGFSSDENVGAAGTSCSELSGIRVLVVDDEPDNRDFLVFLLETYGASVRTATSAYEAVSLIITEKPDVLLSDISLSAMDGCTLIHQIRSLPPEQGGLIPAIALTDSLQEAQEHQELVTGFTLHVPKPVEPSFLATAITNVIER